MKPKIAKPLIYWLHPHFYNWMGGHKFILEVISKLKHDYNLEVYLITSGLNQKAKSEFKKAKVPVIPLFGFSTNNLFYWLILPFFLRLEQWYLLSKVRTPRDAIFISSMFPFNVLATRLGSRTAQVCYEPFAFFYDVHFVSGFNKTQRLFIKLITWLYKGLDKEAVRQTKKIFTLSKYNQKWIESAYQVQSIVVYEGVDLDFFKPTVDVNLRQRYQKAPMIFHATDYTPIKGTVYLIKALPAVLEKVPNLKLVVSETLPDSPAKKMITDLASKLKLQNHIEFAGFLPYAQLPAYLTLAKVVIQPSINQSMNLTVKEAMACETVIITSLEGSEQTQDGEAGYLVDPQQTSTLAKRIVECILNPTKATSMGKRGRIIIKEKFSWDSVTKKIWQGLTKL